MRLHLLPVLLTALILIPSWAASQDEAEGPESTEPFVDVVDVDIVNIDVTVTDKQGNPVAGLGKDDFIVYQDRKPTEVTNFYAVSDGRPAADAAADRAAIPPVPEAGRDSPNPAAAPSRFGVAPEHRLWLIVYIDNYNIDPLERNRIFPELERFIGRSLRTDAQAMLVTYNRSLEVRHPFTDDAPLLYEAMQELVDDSGFAVVRQREQAQTLHRIDKSKDPNQAMLYARQYAEEQMNSVQYTADALQRLIESLGGLPGRKALVHVSSGIPMLAGEEMFHAVAEKFDKTEAWAEIPRHDTTRTFENINRSANAHRVSFYTVDAAGLRGMRFGAAEYAGFVNPSLRSTLDSVVPENLQSSLRFMALETGGRAVLNTNRILPALEKAAQDFRSFYSLGIASTDSETGRYHEIEVKLADRRKGLRLRHRAGYRSKTTETRVQEHLRSALLYSHQMNPLAVKVTLGRAEPHGRDGNYLLPIQLSIPLRDVLLLPTEAGRHEVRLKLFVAAVGEDGGTSQIDSAPLGLRLANEHVEAAKGESLVHTHKLLLSPGRKKVGVAILDLFGRESSVVTESVQVGPDDPDLG